MFNQTERFITQMKLRELRKQRDLLLAKYDQLGADVNAATDESSRLNQLYSGLQSLKFAQQKLHPDLNNLNIPLYEAEAIQQMTDLRDFWWRDLERELVIGRRRAEFVFIFGALLDEWATHIAQPDAGADSFKNEMLYFLSQPSVTGDYQTAINSVLPEQAENRDDFKFLRKQVQPADLSNALSRIQSDTYRSPALRREAQRYLQNQALVNEFAGALTIILENLDDWRWDTITPRVVWMRRRWRVVFDEDLATACLLTILADRWSEVFNKRSGLWAISRLRQWQHYANKNYGRTVLEKERRYIRERKNPLLVQSANLWADEEPVWVNLDDFSDDALKALLNRVWGDESSIVSTRRSKLHEMEQRTDFRSYDGEYGGGLNGVLKLLNADIQTTRATMPDHPIYVIKADLQDFYPSVSHDLILYMLARFGLPEAELNFFRRFLSVPVNSTLTQRGLPINTPLSHVLAEMLLRLMDRYVRDRARVQVIRWADDIGIITLSAEEAVKAWQALQEFTSLCGLTLNENKCGAVAINGRLPSELPEGNPTWLLLSLDSEGEWRVNQREFETVLSQTRERMAHQPALISRVEEYNAAVTFLVNSLAVGVPLGEVHRQEIKNAIARFHYSFEGEGIVAYLRKQIRARVPGDAAIPEAWLYWAITAGGLGLTQPLVKAAGFEKSFRAAKLPTDLPLLPEGWEVKLNEWTKYYLHFMRDLRLAEPVKIDVMETLVKDFIQRGMNLSGGQQQNNLSEYWRWILYTYGPQILEYFGTFRFLITELVPVQLILQKRRGVMEQE